MIPKPIRAPVASRITTGMSTWATESISFMISKFFS